ncbi:hypothetical protein Riv7116_6341 [Rivularia sp. PCC 7116]|uniref:hypothetical protein n=1 Tax=Rivularia sp. PCC 7116 TaxID=373994 RepID=UPI00029EF467|nr:hypothetical protein [Rivularia sp. PCC 7116]AFY58683.1 hypothetical protein Riv7116_6341 [Rivularia sp. PCC 7116]
MTTETVKQFFERAFEKASRKLNSIVIADKNFVSNLGSQVQPNELPEAVVEAFNYYKILYDRDIGDVTVHEVNVDNTPVYAVAGVNTDGDNGYLEIYSKTGEEIACAQHEATIDWMSQFQTRDIWNEYEPEEIKQFFEKAFKESKDRKNFVKKLGERLDLNDLPSNVKQAYSFYKKNVEDANWGNVAIYEVSVKYTSVYTVYTVTEIDENYSELYTYLGELVACARYDFDSFNWSSQAAIRTYVSR